MCLDPALARKARPGDGPPDRVTSSQTLKALVEANKEAPSHQHKDTYRGALCVCAEQHKNYRQTLSNDHTKRAGVYAAPALFMPTEFPRRTLLGSSLNKPGRTLWHPISGVVGFRKPPMCYTLWSNRPVCARSAP